ncbi:kininogen-1 [Tachysurus fulvidraco]|uniref:kininogen-1 n=1 Tax=Tachysurus fulvidraco TaxID=1234273 RepID=UPI000F4E6233|nr:kininogen-1 [Tachysurus fulvidraco]
MQGHSIWVILALSWLFCSGSHAAQETRLQCDDLNVYRDVDLVLSAHNKGLTEGNQLALYQILEAAQSQNESGNFLSVHFTARESNCTAGEDKTWQECDYLQDSSKLLRHCHARLLLKETQEILSHHCSVEPPLVAEPRPPCLGCPESIRVNSNDLKESLSYSLSNANVVSGHTHHFLLNSVAWATRQVIAGFRYRLQFDMQKSNCSKEDFKYITDECHPDPTEPTFINCNSTVDVAPWRHELPGISINCDSGPLQTNLSIRKRPAGWSPLRNIHDFEVKPNKKDSSEESQESKTLSVTLSESQNPTTEHKPSLSIDEALRIDNSTSFNCPSNPWKVFHVRANPPPRPRPEIHEKPFELIDK